MKKITGMHIAQTHLPKLSWLGNDMFTADPTPTVLNKYDDEGNLVESKPVIRTSLREVYKDDNGT